MEKICLMMKLKILSFNFFIFKNNIEVGQIFTGLGLENGAANPEKAALELLEMLKEEQSLGIIVSGKELSQELKDSFIGKLTKN